jgi:hypothetical protein
MSARAVTVVGGSLSEYVSHMRARDNFHGATAHPGLEAELEIFAL